MHWKIRRDPYLSRVCARRGEDAVWSAGFFFDDDLDDASLDDVDWLCTPRPKRAVRGERPVVLLSTGGFCPVHDGHLAMMESARAAAERAGFDVVGGYLSPGHDAYLRMKCGSAAIPAYERLIQCGAAVVVSDWLSVDPWEAMYCRVAVNYTDVAARLRCYLRAHFDPRIEVLYVCGSDNARFAMAFTELGGCIVVKRPGAEVGMEKWRQQLQGYPQILWVDGDGRAISSTSLRGGSWKPNLPRRVVVRLEDSRAVRTLKLSVFDDFQQELMALLSRYVSIRGVRMYELGNEDSVISLDPMLPSTHNLAISRLFAPGGYESRGHVARPGFAPLSEQVAAIPPGCYAFRDDDRMTGGTLKAARALLPPAITVSSTQLCIDPAEDEDVIDSRDFLLGAEHGGLVLALPNGSVGRAPYLLPYVDPAARASIVQSHQFSIDVWELNARIFAKTDLCVRDLPESSRVTFGPNEERRLEELCRSHAARLRRVALL